MSFKVVSEKTRYLELVYTCYKPLVSVARAALFDHMTFGHSFSVGQPDNLGERETMGTLDL